mmetsp:Transcript_8494/g.12663  ORF Transcript_8494/g.12663 Transcript_8494/m.12663 type:complete len:292 (-) Transcript_8494:132-1007(-)
MGAAFSMNFNNWLLAVDGSPIRRMLMSPRSFTPSGSTFRVPPNSWHKSAFLISSVYSPDICGAMDLTSFSYILGSWAILVISRSSVSVKYICERLMPLFSTSMLTTFRNGVLMELLSSILLVLESNRLNMPITDTRVPGVTLLIRYLSTISRMFLGVSPGGTSSGFSCSFKSCVSIYWHLLAIIIFVPLQIPLSHFGIFMAPNEVLMVLVFPHLLQEKLISVAVGLAFPTLNIIPFILIKVLVFASANFRINCGLSSLIKVTCIFIDIIEADILCSCSSATCSKRLRKSFG